MNETIKAIFDRRSIRNFKPDRLTDEQIETLIQVALASPSGMDLQPWLFHFITNQDKMNRISEGVLDAFRKAGNQELLDRMAARHPSIFYGAPLLVVISMSQDNLSGVDAGIAIENLAIAAQSMGLGSCIIGMAAAGFNGDEGDELARLIEMPADHAFVISIAIGYPAMSKKAHARNRDKIKIVD
ncbi:MAG: nitroreductase family protein [Saccharofermentanales bacterium]|jgi:nitroreductase|nr:nitroreductase family protein [Clostridiaceae bacterium]